ncbi:MAG: plasmid mobilization relaxosome protein MobC [Pseudomonadota bacterium]
MARPKKAETEKRTEQLNLRYTLDEKERIRVAAARAGLRPSEYIRRRALNIPVPVKAANSAVDPALIVALNRIGNNVNQLALSVHRGSDFQAYWRDIGGELQGVLSAALERFAP